MSNEALTFVEIDIPVCSLTYGVAPCTASLVSSPPTGTDKCFNSRITCQDIANINLQTVTWRFAKPATYLPRDIDIVSSNILDVDFSPAVVSLGENLGQRASLKVTFKDQPHSDAGSGFDKYYAERTYNPFEQGTLWGKFRARQPFLRGRAMRWITGFVGDTLAEMETRHFFIESTDGPTADGKFSVIAKDALKFLDGDRAQAPIPSNGFLVAGITDIATSATLSPAGIGNSEYAASGLANIGGNELVSFTRVNDVLTITRAQSGTTASAHDAQDRVQVAASYTGLDPTVILGDLIQSYTDLPGAYPDTVTWAVETGTYFNRLLTGIIAEPTPLNKLISEIIEQIGGAMWDDNIAQKIRMQILRGIVTDAYLFSDANVMTTAPLEVTEQPDKRVSQVWVYFGQIDPTKRVDDPDNYRATAIVTDATAETDYGSPAIKKIFARWIPATGRSTAERLANIILGRYRDPPRKFGFDVMRGSVTAPELGGGYQLQWHNLQDAFGARETVPIQVTRLLPGPAIIRVDAEEMRFTTIDQDDLTERLITIDFNTQNFNWKTAHDNLYPAIESGQTCTLVISAGAIIGSNSTASPALDVGTWPAGVTLNLEVVGRIEGAAGSGGRGASAPSGTAVAGSPGGIALYTREAINLTDTSGEIWGGGGGGGGGGRSISSGGGGGGGGGGQLPGAGGIGGFGTPFDGAAGSPGTTEAAADGGLGGNGTATKGGFGGAPGVAGNAGGGTGAAAGGVAGSSIDGISLITTIGGAGDRRGSQVN